MYIRKYQQNDCREVISLFYDTVHTVNAADYTELQLSKWATGKEDLKEWNESLMKNHSLVAVEGDCIIGFGDIAGDGYLNRLFVHKDYQRKGVASVLCGELEHAAGNSKITAHVSITARPFFEKRGYKVIKKQEVKRSGEVLVNYIMKKENKNVT